MIQVHVPQGFRVQVPGSAYELGTDVPVECLYLGGDVPPERLYGVKSSLITHNF